MNKPSFKHRFLTKLLGIDLTEGGAVAHARAESIRLQLSEIIYDLYEPTPCRYDHNGDCQEHLWFGLDSVCPHERIRNLMKSGVLDDTGV